MPPSAAAASTQIMASPITRPRSAIWNQAAATAPMITAKPRPLRTPTNNSRRTTAPRWRRQDRGWRCARTATVMDCVPALPPMLATIGISTASATIFSIEPSNWLITQRGQQRGHRLASSQGKRLRTMVQTESDKLLVAADAAQRLDVLFGLLLDDVDDVVEGEDADQLVAVVHHRCGNQVVALEHARHLLLVLGRAHPPALGIHQVGQRGRPLVAQQQVERHRAKQL